MKLQIGMLYRNHRPSEWADLAALLGEFRSAEYEISGETLDGPLAMVYRGDVITPEEASETQPLRHGSSIFTWDGRLDNRQQILARLDTPYDLGAPDPVIVADAYQMYGEQIFPELVGEFAFTIWSSRTRELLFVRSFCGTRPLYYVLTKEKLIWSTDFAHLVRVSDVDLEINDKCISEYLIAQPNAAHTPLKHVSVIPHNSVVRFQDGEFKPPRQLWNPYNIKRVTYHSDHEYEEHLLETLTEAVQVRLRNKHPVVSELSGGLDSSTLVLVADRLAHVQGQQRYEMRTVSYVYTSPTCDEDYFIRQIENARGLQSHRIFEEDQEVTLGLRDITFTGLPSPLHCFPGRYKRVAAHMRQFGARVLFSGNGGDHLFWSAPDSAAMIADHMRGANFIDAFKECRVRSQLEGVPYLALFKKALPLAVPELMSTPPEKTPAWVLQSNGNSSSGKFTRGQTLGLPSFRAHLFQINGLFTQLAMGYRADYRDITFTYPYAHRPLVEFCLGTPISQFIRRGETRSIMRRALRHILPSVTLQRKSKGGLEEVFCRAIQKDWDALGDFRTWEICKRGFADADLLARDLNLERLGVPVPYGNFALACATERWLRSLQLIHAPNRSDWLTARFAR